MRRTTLLVLGLGAAVGLYSGAVSAQDTEPSDAKYEIPAEVVRKDLQLVVERTDDRPVWTGELPAVAVSLRNRSRSTRHTVVMPGDGSMVGWREPHIRYEVERFGADGDPAPVETQGIMRCGNYDANWLDELTALGPGAKVTFEHYGPITWIHDLVRPGRYRIRGVYAFSRKSSRGSQWDGAEDGPPEFGAMAPYAPYELTSDWVEWTAMQPVRVTIVRTGTVAFGASQMASEVLVARVENVSAETLTIRPDQVAVTVEFERRRGNLTATADARDAAPRAPIRLEPGDHIPVFGPGGLTSGDLVIAPRRIDATATDSPAAEFAIRVAVRFDAPRTVIATSDTATLHVVAAR